ncbi:GIY-YIG nuclease family protein [Mycobacterium sp. 23]
MNIPAAEPISVVTRYGVSAVSVRCPYCRSTHAHNVRTASDATRCAAPCGKGAYYIYKSPPPHEYDDHVLYRFFSEDGALLYVGITNSPRDRFSQHRSTAPWWKEATNITLTRYTNRNELAAAEIQAIKTENPKYNRTHTQPPPAQANRPIRKLRSSNARRGEPISNQANAFQAPDAIACDGYQPPQDKLPLAAARKTWALPCPDCNSSPVYQEPDGLIKCTHCGNMWLYDEWAVLVGIRLPPLPESADE